MTITIGRFGIDLKAGEVASFDVSGAVCKLSGVTAYSGRDDAIALRQQLSGYVDSPDELFVPVTWDEDPSVDGYYRVTGASVNARAGLAWLGVVEFSIDLERVRGFAAPLIESVCLGKVRTSILGITARSMASIPAAAKSVAFYLPNIRAFVPFYPNAVRVGEKSTLNVFSDFGDYTIIQHYVPPARFYEGAVTLRSGSPLRVNVGRQIQNVPDLWELSNDIFQVRPVPGSAFALEFRMFIGPGWGVWRSVTFTSQNFSDPRFSLSSPHTITVLSNAPDAVTIRLLTTTDGNYSPVTVDLTLRRGARSVAVELRSVFTSNFEFQFSTNDIQDGYLGGWSGSNGAPLVVVGSAVQSDVNTTGRFRVGASSVWSRDWVPFTFGMVSAPADVQKVLNEYFWAGSEKQSVVAQ